jgi:dienelactone hydrolase
VSIGPALAIGSVGRSGRSPVHTDAIEARIISGAWRPPAAGDRVELPNGTNKQWRVINKDTNGWFEDAALRGGYVYAPVVADSECVRILEAQGNSLVYVNGELRQGDPYQNGYVHLPVPLRAGTNDFLFQCGGRLKFSLVAPAAPVSINTNDPTLPDLIAGRSMDTWGAVVIVNATGQTQTNLAIRASIGGKRAVATALPNVLPFSVRKMGFRLRGKESGATESASQIRSVLPDTPHNDAGETKVSLQLTLVSESEGRKVLDRATTQLRVRGADQVQKRTFISEIDGSVQYWALNPAAAPEPGNIEHRTSNAEHRMRGQAEGPSPAMFFSLHGASVEARGQAEAYEPKSWGDIVVPTNRRPYGFDWEDWGRLDALEVLNIAKAELNPDPQRIYLTGHSMGGHGAWQLGALFPSLFAADGVSAGWISFFSYAGGARFTNNAAIEAILQRAAATSDTLLMKSNFLQEGVYILHGSEDDNVPVTEARQMRTNLAAFDHDFEFHEQPGQGHWWDLSDEPGADCVDWPPMFDYFARHSIPRDEDVREVNFTTVNPGVSAHCHWLEIEQQIHPLVSSSVDVRWDPGKRRFVGTTANIAQLAFDLKPIAPGKPLKVELDGQTLDGIAWPTNAGALWLQKADGQWRVSLNSPRTLSTSSPRTSNIEHQTSNAEHLINLPVSPERLLTPTLSSTSQRRGGSVRADGSEGPYASLTGKFSPDMKGPARNGPFKDAFRHRMIFVYGTKGTAEENAWALAKARFDAETFWYRGNGSVDVMPDTAFDAQKEPDRGVVLYGNADSNGAWPALLSNSPVQVRRNQVKIGERALSGNDLACLFLRPRPGSATACVAVVSGTDLAGMKLTDRLNYFLSGVEYPDCTVIGPEMLREGVKGVRAAGFFGNDWSVDQGDFAWGTAVTN